ncbi:MAG: amylo-alpha-1,6-glucosidase [Alphaproteobacteria bacterium]
MIDMPVRIFRPSEKMNPAETDALLRREWIITNGLGGYASGTVAGVSTRRYHGFLVSAEPAPLGRMLMLKRLFEQFRLPDGKTVSLSGHETEKGRVTLPAAEYLKEFRLEYGIPIWEFEADGVRIERRVVMPYRQNTVHVFYRLLEGPSPLKIELRPGMRFHPHDATYDANSVQRPYLLTLTGNRYEVSAGTDLPVLRLQLNGGHSSFVADGGASEAMFFRVESERGYESTDLIWSPGYFSVSLEPGEDIAFSISTDPWMKIEAMQPLDAEIFERDRRSHLLKKARPEVRAGVPAELVIAADQFLFDPAGRIREHTRARASDDSVRAVIAGYHWFTDWGRDTMISLEGLTLVTGRTPEAAWILRSMNRHVRDGLLPNLFPEGSDDGLYHTADATLWFFHAIDRYLAYTQDRETLRTLLPTLIDIALHHVNGTRFGIRVDPDDGLLVQGQEGYQLTWMDAKVGDWVVTPRRGKAVEINALWYNALRLLAQWLAEEERIEAAAPWLLQAEKAKKSFNEKFWCESAGHLFDVIDGEHGNDGCCRPNQIISFSLRYPVLDPDRWPQVLDVVEKRLLTPVGLRTLAAGHKDYRAQYFGDLRSRDAAYHQGTVWPWLIGPFVDAWLAVHPEDHSHARRFLMGFIPHMEQACIGTISEICDAEEPFIPRGCISQAWSIAEVLRCWAKTNGACP